MEPSLARGAQDVQELSYWENGPSSTGHMPSLDVLGRLAQLYQCSVSDLATAALTAAETEVQLDDLVNVDGTDSRGTLALTGRSRGAPSLVQRVHELSYHELAQVIVMWMGRLASPVTRRALMSKLSAAFTVAAAAPLFDVLDRTSGPRWLAWSRASPTSTSQRCVTAPKWPEVSTGKVTHSAPR